MTPEQALKILTDVTGQVAMKRQDHQAVIDALKTLQDLAARVKSLEK